MLLVRLTTILSGLREKVEEGFTAECAEGTEASMLNLRLHYQSCGQLEGDFAVGAAEIDQWIAIEDFGRFHFADEDCVIAGFVR